MKSIAINRREILQKTLLTTSGLLLARMASAVPTPPQTEGPFYPIKDQLDKDADMTQVMGHAQEATGTRIYLAGTVFSDRTNKPIPGAVVEFWQACHTGKYDHPDDTNPAQLDPDFQYWAQVKADKSGSFALKTIKPGAYPAEPGWVRPPHIHVKVHAQGYPSLTTQIYFAGDALNDKDLILQKVPAAKRNLVIVSLTPRNGELQACEGTWNIFLADRSDFKGQGTPTIE